MYTLKSLISGNAGFGLDLHEILSAATMRLNVRTMVLFMSHLELLQLLGKKLFAYLCPAHESEVLVLFAFYQCTYPVKYFKLITLGMYT